MATQDRAARFKQLQAKMADASKQNRKDVIEEDKRNKLPPKSEKKLQLEEKKLSDEKLKEECKERGEDYLAVKMRTWSADDVDKWERKKNKRKNPDEGFSDFAQASERKFARLFKQLKPDMEAYNKEKERLGDAFYAGADTLGVVNHVDTKENIDRMVADIEKQIAKRAKYSRRRTYHEDEDVDFINDKNRNFNKKLEKCYGSYTAEIKQNLERGTAL